MQSLQWDAEIFNLQIIKEICESSIKTAII